MRIDSSVIGMESERTYSSVSGRVSKFTITEGRADLAEGTGNLFGNLLQPEEGDPEQAKEKETSEDFITKTMEEMRAKQARRTGSIKTPEMEETRRQLYSIRQQCLNFLMNLLFPDRMGLRDETDEEVSQGTDSGESSLQSVVDRLLSASTSHLRTFTFTRQYYYEETEETSYTTQGTVKCADQLQSEPEYEPQLSGVL